MASNSNTPAGLLLPTLKSFTPGAGNPRDSAMMAQQDMNAKQASLNASVGGKKGHRRHFSGGANNTVVVPQFQMQYTPQGGVGTNPNDQIKSTSSTSMQSTAWAVDDHLATKMGGTKGRRRSKKTYRKRFSKRMSRNKKGGNWNPNWSWGCYSGGRKTRRNKSNRKRRM